MRNTTAAMLEYLVLKILAGKEDVVKALYDYFVEGVSPSSIAMKYNLSKHQVRGYIQRIMEKSGSSLRAKVLIKHIIPIVTRLRPIVKKAGNSLALCSLCGEELPLQIVEDHIKKRHPEVVAECVNTVVETLKRSITLKSRR